MKISHVLRNAVKLGIYFFVFSFYLQYWFCPEFSEAEDKVEFYKLLQPLIKHSNILNIWSKNYPIYIPGTLVHKLQ